MPIAVRKHVKLSGTSFHCHGHVRVTQAFAYITMWWYRMKAAESRFRRVQRLLVLNVAQRPARQVKLGRICSLLCCSTGEIHARTVSIGNGVVNRSLGPCVMCLLSCLVCVRSLCSVPGA